MSSVGERERQTQERVIRLFRERLGYAYLGNGKDRAANRNVEPDLLWACLKQRGYDDTLPSGRCMQ